MQVRRALAIGFLAWVLTSCSLLSATAAGSDGGDRTGLALLVAVRKAYGHVPAVVIAGSAELPGAGRITTRFTQVLRASTIVAEEGDLTGGGMSRKLVKHLGTATYVRDSGQRCWQRVPRSDQRDLTDVGRVFLGAYRQRVEKPRRSGPNWLLTAHVQDRDGTRGTLTYVVDRSTLVVRSATTEVGGQRVVQRFHSLHSAPMLAATTPRC